jgi:hypothetical protein
MIQPKELRIGNILYFPFTDEFVEVLGINAHEQNNEITNSISFKKDASLYCEKISVLQPIKLTEEVFLNNLGGQKDSDSCVFTYLDSRYDLRIYPLIDEKTKEIFGICFCKGAYGKLESHCHIKSLHQVQNYYYIKTGQEIKINYERNN